MGEVLVADEADHAVELFVGRGFELPGDVGDAVRVVACVADRKRLFAQLLPAAHERGVGCRVARTFEEGAAGDGQRRLLVQEIDRCGCRDHVAALVVAPRSRSTSKLRLSRVRCMQKCWRSVPQRQGSHENSCSA